MQLRGGIFRGFEVKLPFDYDYQQVLNRATALGYSLPTSAQQVKENQLMIDIKAAFGVTSSKSSSNIASVPVLQMLMFATDGDSDYATISWSAPSNSAKQATKVNSPSFTALSGFNSNGTTSYLNSRLALDTTQQRNVAFAVKAFINNTNTGIIVGNSDVSPATTTDPATTITPRSGVSNLIFRLMSNTANTISSANTDGDARIIVGRSSTSNVYRSLNGAAKTNNTSNDLTYSTPRVLYLLARNLANVSTDAFYTNGISYFIAFNTNITNGEIAAVDTALATYLS
jgi:hypothetical protein